MDKKEYAPTVLRLFLGLLFILAGLGKLMDPDKIINLLQGLGFLIPVVLGWVLLLSEIIFGIAVLFGWYVKYAVWPLVFIMVVATLTVVLPSFEKDPMAIASLLFHLLALGGLVSVFLSGPGALAVSKE